MKVGPTTDTLWLHAEIERLRGILRKIAQHVALADPADDPNDYMRGLTVGQNSLAEIARDALKQEVEPKAQ